MVSEMASGANMGMLSALDNNLQGSNGNLSDVLQSELELLLRQHRNNQQAMHRGGGRGMNMYRSGSAPPSVEGSLSAVGSLFRNSDFTDSDMSSTRINSNNNNEQGFSDDEVRSHIAYLSYYYSHDNSNPRNPPPLLSREDWRVAQRFQGGSCFEGGNGESWRRNGVVSHGDKSLFSTQPGISVAQKAENELMKMRNVNNGGSMHRHTSSEWLDHNANSLNGFSTNGLGERRKSFADILQEGVDHPSSYHMLRPSSCNAFGDAMSSSSMADPHPLGLRNGAVSHSFASAGGPSLTRSRTPDFGRSSLPPVGRSVYPNVGGTDMQSDSSSVMTDLSALSLSKVRSVDEDSRLLQSQLRSDIDKHRDFLLNAPTSTQNQRPLQQQQLMEKSNVESFPLSTNYAHLANKNGILTNRNVPNGHVNFPRRTSSPSLYSNSSGLGSFEGLNTQYQDASTSRVGLDDHSNSISSYPVNQKMKNHIDAAGFTSNGDEQIINKLGNKFGLGNHASFVEPSHIQPLQTAEDYPRRALASTNGYSLSKNNYGTLHGELEGQRAYLEALLAQRKYEMSLLGKIAASNHCYIGNPSYGLSMTYPGIPVGNSVLPASVGNGSSMFQNEKISRFNSMMRSSMRGSVGSAWNAHDVGNDIEGRHATSSSLLDEFKNNKNKSFELADIVDHVVEFSTDQYGSRFIQQKLETANVEEKMRIFPEIIPHARTLMTDVFGNYVIQKFFEHGTESQRKELTSQLTGHVLALSLQMYGCRVIQKALEVVEIDQQIKMVSELDGSVMKCVRDQNGNHVIQKSIECVPQDKIQFIISSFSGQVVTLSTHPFGCRVIQRVLELCNDSKTQETIMDEVMKSVCILAQDQYGNYVIQHVLEHGKQHERSAIIHKLAGKIVKMSQEKFASNVVEKCLIFGSPEERRILVKEMLGFTVENEPLQAMMKDPFGNYVVQKVLETCDDQSLELILSRIKVHLTAMKKYTYGKHIVTRVEKLITTGERRKGLSSADYSSTA